jgi:DNA-binding MarR family transcriptional regulator
MLDQTLTYLTEFASAVGRGFMLPGDLLLSGFAWIAPQSAEVLSFGTGRSVATLVLALFGWTMIVIIGLLLSRLCRAVARQMNAILRILVWRIKMLLGNLKTRMLWKYREYFPHKTTQTETVSQTQFDDLDIAVLASMSRQGPGMASSAPELAEKYKLRPTQIQRRLDKLQKNEMLCSVIGSTDGFENYRLTESGLALIAVCERQATARASVVSV